MKKIIIPLLTCFIVVSYSPHSVDEENKAKELAKTLSYARSDLIAIF